MALALPYSNWVTLSKHSPSQTQCFPLKKIGVIPTLEDAGLMKDTGSGKCLNLVGVCEMSLPSFYKQQLSSFQSY